MKKKSVETEETELKLAPVPSAEHFARALGKDYDGYVQAFAEIDGTEYKVLRHTASGGVRVYSGNNDITAVVGENMLRAFGGRAGGEA